MGLQYKGFTTGQRGIELAETGINLQGFSVRYYPQFKDFRNNFQGQEFGFAMPDKLNRDVTITGDVIVGTTTGVMACDFATAFTPANDIGDFTAANGGSNAGGLYLNEVGVDQTADGWRTVSAQFKSSPLIT